MQLPLLDLTENVIRLRRQLRDIEIQAESQMQSRTAAADERHAEAGFDPMECMQAIQDPAVKDALKAATAEAVERGVFGVPTFFVGGEMFWGQDRLHFVDAALA